MPTIYFIIKRFLARYQPIQRKLEAVEYSLEIEKLMQAIRTMPAEELKARLAASQVTIESQNQTTAGFLKNVNVLLEAEKTRQKLQLATLEEVKKLNAAIAAELKKEAEKWN